VSTWSHLRARKASEGRSSRALWRTSWRTFWRLEAAFSFVKSSKTLFDIQPSFSYHIRLQYTRFFHGYRLALVYFFFEQFLIIWTLMSWAETTNLCPNSHLPWRMLLCYLLRCHIKLQRKTFCGARSSCTICATDMNVSSDRGACCGEVGY